MDNIKEAAIYLMNLRQSKFLYVSHSIHSLLGYLPETFLEGGAEFLYSIIHPKDFPKARRKHISFIDDIVHERHEGIHLIHQRYRLRHDEGKWITMENITVVLSYEDGHPANAIGYLKKARSKDATFTENSPGVAELLNRIPPEGLSELSDNRAMFIDSLVHEEGLPELIEISLEHNVEVEISNREKQVLQLIATGLSTKEIADRLYISNTTVLSHRKNLLNKFQAKNTAELINKASKKFWLS